MKKNVSFLMTTLMLIVTMGLSSCSKDEDKPTLDGKYVGTLNSDQIEFNISGRDITCTYEGLDFAGTIADNGMFTIMIPVYQTVHYFSGTATTSGVISGTYRYEEGEGEDYYEETGNFTANKQ